ncbi:IclR family transcriptional regulator [Sphingomonas elodea]|uniref:IclR family transcriptional regulator n=1 Tax=Sphingomonas elodea TaxID=179878 RepID=UPI000263086C|nr:IclR family transcriptional regulator [Sphingomonas elodea]
MPKRTGAPSQRKGSYSAPALDKAFLIIELLANNPQGLLASEMAAALGRSLGELFRIVVVMEEAGYLQKSELTDRYTATYKFLDVAYRATPARKLVVTAQPEMQALAATIGQSCHLVVAKAGEGLVIAREENPGTRSFALRIGATIDLIDSCSGHVLLAFASEERAVRMRERASALRDTPIDEATLATHLRTARADGYCLRQSPITRGVTDISCPVLGFDGELLAALTVPYLEVVDGSQLMSVEQSLQELIRTARRISEALGWRPAAAAETTPA